MCVCESYFTEWVKTNAIKEHGDKYCAGWCKALVRENGDPEDLLENKAHRKRRRDIRKTSFDSSDYLPNNAPVSTLCMRRKLLFQVEALEKCLHVCHE